MDKFKENIEKYEKEIIERCIYRKKWENPYSFNSTSHYEAIKR